jgi:hypothetical protein
MSQASSARPITGDDIISELIRNLEAGAFKVRYTTLLPCVFNVYLHAGDYEQVRPIAEFIRTEAKQALAEHISALNKGSGLPSLVKWLGFEKERPVQFKTLDADWTIEFHRDDEERLRRGDIEIYSELGSGEREELGAGAKTTFITRRPVEEQPEPSAQRPPASTDRQTYAYLRYKTAAGNEATFPITRDATVIGRGGKAFWVDLKVEGPADVSREHCRVRRDGTTGRFFIKDLSQYGTTVDGKPVPSSVARSSAGDKVDKNIEVPLPDRATIGLAGVCFIEFEAAPPA